MSLIEVMIAMVVFMMLAIGITSAVFQSQQIAQNNIIRNTAYTVAQGYLEQIKSVSISELADALDDPDGTPLPTMSVSALNINSIEILDPIFLDGPEPALSGQTDGSNFREILIDLKEDPKTGDIREIVMNAWYDIDVAAIENRSNSFSIIVRFEAELRGLRNTRISGDLRGIRSDINSTAVP